MSDSSQGLLLAKKMVVAYLDRASEDLDLDDLNSGALLVVLLSIAESLEEIATRMP